ncbi:PP0621 family protein [Marinomonas sp. THO17]|uniref:PP0621 family protein n=1 Tax=Marinomonas sp. THO17 TaxID=3149048 RepID=UPI00336C1CFF
MIVRLIVFITIFFIGWWLYRQFVVFKGQKTTSNTKKTKQKGTQAEQENMVRCLQCKTYVPLSHAIHDEQARPFCSAEHLKEFNQTN